MLDVGFSELLVFGVIALLVLGPDKLPEAARFAAKSYSKFKRVISNVQNDIDRELRLSEFREQMNNEMKRIQELEQKMQAQMDQLQQQKILEDPPEQAPQATQAVHVAAINLKQLNYQQLSIESNAAYIAPWQHHARMQQQLCTLHQSEAQTPATQTTFTQQRATQVDTGLVADHQPSHSDTVAATAKISALKVAV